MKRRSMLGAIAAVPLGITCGAPLAAWAHSYKAADIAIGHAWALPAQQGGDGQVFIPLLNNGKEADALVAARCEPASYIELRENNHYVEPALKEFALPPGKPFAMRPTARHLRLVGLSRPFAKGDRFKLVLDFLNAGEIEIEVHVEPASAE